MSKRTTTRWYMGAWLVWLLAFIAVVMATHGSNTTLNAVPATARIGYIVMAVAGLVMLVMWIAALIKLGMLRAWGWLVGVFILQLVGLGIIGMAAYAVSGPEDVGEVVYRPTAT